MAEGGVAESGLVPVANYMMRARGRARGTLRRACVHRNDWLYVRSCRCSKKRALPRCQLVCAAWPVVGDRLLLGAVSTAHEDRCSSYDARTYATRNPTRAKMPSAVPLLFGQPGQPCRLAKNQSLSPFFFARPRLSVLVCPAPRFPCLLFLCMTPVFPTVVDRQDGNADGDDDGDRAADG